MTEPTSYQLAILDALQSKLVYGGTVSEKTKRTRRRRNRAAARQRRINRGRA